MPVRDQIYSKKVQQILVGLARHADLMPSGLPKFLIHEDVKPVTPCLLCYPLVMRIHSVLGSQCCWVCACLCANSPHRACEDSILLLFLKCVAVQLDISDIPFCLKLDNCQ